MKSASLGTLLSVISLVGVGILYVKVDDLGDRVRPLTKGRADRHLVSDVRDDPIERDAPARLIAEDRRRPAGESKATATTRKSSDKERIAKLEKELANLKQRPRMPSFKMPRFARSVGGLAKMLKLDKTQETRIQDAVDRAKQRIEDVMKIPDETGVSPYERRTEAREKMKDAMKTGKWGDVAKLAMESRSARAKTIPGRNTTYSAEVDRIKKEARDEIKSNLTQDQAKEFEDTRIDPLLGEPGTQSVMAFTASGGDGKTSDAAVVVEGGIDIVHADESEAEKDDDK